MLRALKWSILRFVGRRGYHIIPEWRREEGCLGLHLQRLFDFQKIDCVIDVGGNEGEYRDLLREFVGYRGLIISFEPDEDLLKVLRKRARKDPSWQIEDVALGSVAGYSDFHIMDDRHFNSFLTPTQHPVLSKWNRVVETRKVEVATLNAVYPLLKQRYGFATPYLKLDTQGFDAQVLAGAFDVLHEFAALQTEASVEPAYQGMVNYETTIRMLNQHGFALSGMFSVTGATFPTLLEFDCVMVNTRFRGCASTPRQIQQ